MNKIYNPEATPAERLAMVDKYLFGLPKDEAYLSESFAEDLLYDGPVANTLVIIPVAAHQEAAQIPNALAEYARQQPTRPFTVILGLNCPSEKIDDSSIDDSIAAVEIAKKQHQDLDVRYTFLT